MRLQSAFGALVLAQAAHSTEEYAGRLWESFPPARLVSSLASQDLARGFLILNLSLVVFGLWCWLVPVRRGWPVAVPLAWGWVLVEIVNGIGHPLWSLRQGAYTPGVLTPFATDTGDQPGTPPAVPDSPMTVILGLPGAPL